MIILGVQFVGGKHNPARLEFKYGRMSSIHGPKDCFIVHDEPRLYGVWAFKRFFGLIRFPKDKTTEQREVPDDRDPIRCHAARDGECYWKWCPQERDNEPHKTGRHCPLDFARHDED